MPIERTTTGSRRPTHVLTDTTGRLQHLDVWMMMDDEWKQRSIFNPAET